MLWLGTMLTSSFSRLLVFRPRKSWAKSGIGATAAILAFLLARWTPPEHQLEASFVFFYLAIFSSSIIGGGRAGFSATFLSLTLIVFSFWTRYAGERIDFIWQVAGFAVWSLGTSYVIGLIKNAYQISLSVINNLHSFVAILEPTGKYIDLNTPALEILDVPRDQLIGRHFLSKKIPLTFTPAHRKQIETALHQAQRGSSSRFDIRFTNNFRHHTYLDLSISPIFDRLRNVIFLVVSATSITPRMEAEAKATRLNKSLQQKVNELQTLFEVLPVGIAITNDPECKEVRVNSALQHMLGITEAESDSIGDLLSDRKAPFYFMQGEKRLSKHQLPMRQAGKKRLPLSDQELAIVRADGSKKDVLINAAPILNEAQEVSGCVSAFVDLTERKKVEEALINSELRFKRLVDSNLIGVIVTNLDGEVLEANEALLSMIGYTQEEVHSSALNWKNITPEEYTEVDQQAIEQLRTEGEARPYEKVFFRKDGSKLPVLIGAVMAEARTETCVAFILDISARRKLEQRKDEFIGLASHELKTPLTSIKVFTQLLGRSLVDSSDQQNLTYVDKMNLQIDRLTSLVEELLDVSKIEAGKLQLNYDQADLEQLVKDTIFEVQSISTQHQIVLHGRVKEKIAMDAYRMSQVISNLLTNAVKYSPNADKIDVRLKETAREVSISIQDYGLGIPETEQKQIFEKFFRARGKDRHSFPGLGLGLYVSSQIIKRHGGKITVKSKEGDGSTFTFTVPKKVMA